jgi:hypothetical protein
MHLRPDYEALRRDTATAFEWSVTGSYLAYLKMAEVPARDFFLEPEACIEVYRTGRQRVEELFGPDVGVAGPTTPPISYGHPNSLGAELYFPEGGEVAVEHVFQDSLDRAIAALKQPVDFGRAPRAQFYLNFLAQMQKAFPGEEVWYAYSWEGPVTTAYEFRGDAFFLDVLDEPEKTQEFLGLLTTSVLDFYRWHCSISGRPVIKPDSAMICDDIASMIPPRLWETFVLPYWDQYFNGVTSGRRLAHVEDLRPTQLRHLETIGLWYYDPSVSRQINPQVIARECRVPFGWRLVSFHYRGMTCRDVEDFVFQAAADGACKVFTVLEGTMCEPPHIEKVKAFIRAGKEVKRLLDRGGTRAELRERVSEKGRQKFWQTWLD